MSIRVIIADDHALVRDGLRALFERKAPDIEIVAEVTNGIDLIALAPSRLADVYIVDISMPLMNGLDAASRILKVDTTAKIIIVTMHDDRRIIEDAITRGVKGYLLKESAAEELIAAIRNVYQGNFYISSRASQYIVGGFLTQKDSSRGKKKPKLTQREREVLQLISEGFTDKDIALRLHVAYNTIHVHRTNMMRKLNFHKSTELVRFALKEKISSL